LLVILTTPGVYFVINISINIKTVYFEGSNVDNTAKKNTVHFIYTRNFICDRRLYQM
jgi:hypothetical protein